MLRHLILAMAIAAIPTVPAFADDSKTAVVSADAETAKEKKVCRRQIPTGSVMPKTVCRTKAQWEALTDKAQRDLDRTRDIERSRSSVGTARGI